MIILDKGQRPIYVRVQQTEKKKTGQGTTTKTLGSLTIFDADPVKVFAIVKDALKKASQRV